MRTVELEPAERIAADKAAWRARRAEELLGRIDLFSALPAEARQRLAASARQQYFDAGERLVAEGETGDSLFVIARGSVMISKSGRAIGTTSVALAVLREGEFFGEMSLLTGAPRSATVTAEGPGEVFVLDRQALAPILEADPQIAEVLSKRLAERMAATAARFEDREEEIKRARETDENTILRRIRSFFGLGGALAARAAAPPAGAPPRSAVSCGSASGAVRGRVEESSALPSSESPIRSWHRAAATVARASSSSCSPSTGASRGSWSRASTTPPIRRRATRRSSPRGSTSRSAPKAATSTRWSTGWPPCSRDPLLLLLALRQPALRRPRAGGDRRRDAGGRCPTSRCTRSRPPAPRSWSSAS